MGELIIVKQLPVIEQQLQSISKDIDNRIAEIEKLEINEETIKEVKKVRTEFKKDFENLEEKRKEVKKAILNPYEQFEEIYKQYVSNKFNETDKKLKNKIDDIENQIKSRKEQEIKEYFEEYKKSNNIDFVSYEQAKIKVGLSDSVKSLKTQAKDFIDKIVNDLELINTQENKEEILVEYKQNLNVSLSITTVLNRIKAIEEEKRKKEEKEKSDKELQQYIIDTCKESDKVEYFEEPEVEEKILTLKFTVKGTKKQLKELKKFLNEGGYIYE